METKSPLDVGIDPIEDTIIEDVSPSYENRDIEIPLEIKERYASAFQELGADYFITITYHPRCRLLFDQFTPSAQLSATRKELVALLKLGTNFILKPELTQQGKIHYHAMLKITDKIKWYKKILPTLNAYGRMRVENIRNAEKCMNYILKEYNDYCQIFNKSYILYHNCTSFRLAETPVNDVIELSKFIKKLKDK